MDHFLVGSRSFLLAISQGRKLPATAHWWFSSYSKLCGSLSRTSTKGERGGGRRSFETNGLCQSYPHPALWWRGWPCVGHSVCVQAVAPGHLGASKDSLFLFSEVRSCRLLLWFSATSWPQIWCAHVWTLVYYPAAKWPREREKEAPWKMYLVFTCQNAKLPKWPDWVFALL